MRTSYLGIAVCGGLFVFSSTPAFAVEIATGKPVIGESSSWGITHSAPGRFNSTHAVDGVITEPTENPGGSGENEWLADENLDSQSFTIDLGGQYNLSSISLYNTHNGQYNDSRTVTFSVLAGNTIAASGNTPGTTDGNGMQLSGGLTVVSDSLSNVDSQSPITPDVFSSLTNATNVRYIQFVENTHSGSRGGLNEIMIDGTAVPEPTTAGLVGGAIFLLSGRRPRNRD